MGRGGEGRGGACLTSCLLLKSLQKTKQLLRWVDREKLEQVNVHECDVLEERWLSEECMKAILDFMQRKKA